MTLTILLVTLLKVLVLSFVVINVVPLMTWVERRGSAFIQGRIGPNRVGPLGLFQPIADGIKFIMKEDTYYPHVDKILFIIAPALALIPAILAFAAIPFGPQFTLWGYTTALQIADINIGVIYVLAIASLSIYGILLGGWASNNKYSFLGSVRSSAQMISYEVALGLSIVGLLMIYETTSLKDMVLAQSVPLWGVLPKWGIFTQPVAFLLFWICIFAETNRLPFDLPEGETELVAGYHTEYSGMKFALFFMSEYMAMFTGSALAATLFLGGWAFPPGIQEWILNFGLSRNLFAFICFINFMIKVAFFLWCFVWVRWTFPRFRYDQLMKLGWKFMIPVALLNILATGFVIYGA
ncbi:MAG: NADH-quinone oxidoreductase subunit NuoH [Deltaproteobacteria bacterium]|nr:NADH-quinone oxidoreductase subunit NuoH [Deltaproteobacteria bacterium]